MILKNASKIWKSEGLRKKIYATLGILVVYKLLGSLPIPGVDVNALALLQESIRQQEGLLFFSALMGGGLEQFSIILMGLSPYINASIIIQLLMVLVPSLEALKKEGQQGQKKISQYTRILTVPLAFAQSYGMILLLNSLAGIPLIDTANFFGAVLPAMIIVTGGTMFLLWLGELITERGIGNGVSLIIFAGVLAGTPGVIASRIATPYIFLGLLALTLLVIYIIIKFTEGYRKIPLVYTRTGRDERSFFPIRINQAGMIPIIFAISVVTFPGIIGQILTTRSSETLQGIGTFFQTYFDPNAGGWIFIVAYFLLIVLFSYFYVSITFNTDDVAESIQKRGGYIPGIRPGSETAEYLRTISNRLNFFGGSFLALIAVFPYLANQINSILANNGFKSLPLDNIDFLINGAGLIIVVGVILDIMRRVDAELKSYNYKRFY